MTTRVERVGAGTVTAARRGTAHKMSATTRAEERNIRALILQKRVLSRGNWRSGTGSAEVKFRRPRQERRKSNIEKPTLKHEQEWYRQKLTVGDCEPDEVGEVDSERQFRVRQGRFQRAILALSPGLGLAFDAVLRRSGEIGFVIEDRLQNGARVVE